MKVFIYTYICEYRIGCASRQVEGSTCKRKEGEDPTRVKMEGVCGGLDMQPSITRTRASDRVCPIFCPTGAKRRCPDNLQRKDFAVSRPWCSSALPSSVQRRYSLPDCLVPSTGAALWRRPQKTYLPPTQTLPNLARVSSVYPVKLRLSL